MNLEYKKIYINIAFFSLIIIVVFCFGILPPYFKIIEISEKLMFNKKNLEIANNQLQEIRNFKKNYSAYEQILNKINLAFIDKDNPIEFIEFLENLAAETNVAIKISPGVFSNIDNYTTFSISVGGSFGNIINFIKKIEDGGYLLQINNFSIKNSFDEKKGNSFSSQFLIKILVKK